MMKISVSFGEMDILIAQSIRESVFIKEKKIPGSVEKDGYDKNARHLIAWLNFEPVGCARLRLTGDTFQLDKLAVLDRFRKKGVAKAIIKYAIDYAKEEGVKKIFLQSPLEFRSFFENTGFISRENADTGTAEGELEMIIQFDD